LHNKDVRQRKAISCVLKTKALNTVLHEQHLGPEKVAAMPQ
jgi:hypothetical protein